jgi:hypothetical protein
MGVVLSAAFPEEHLSAAYLRLATLPPNLSGVQMSDGEDDPRYPVTFEDLAHNKKVPVNTDGGYFLHAQDASYGVNFFNAGVKFFIECASDEAAHRILRAVADLPISYAYAGQFEERKHQNRITAKKKYGTEETWVGRDYHRYLPGLYWLNLVPKSLLERHGISEMAIKSIAASCEEVGGKNYLIQLYPSSSDWPNRAPEIDKWRKETPGVFYKAEAEIALAEAGNFLEASDATRVWP